MRTTPTGKKRSKENNCCNWNLLLKREHSCYLENETDVSMRFGLFLQLPYCFKNNINFQIFSYIFCLKNTVTSHLVYLNSMTRTSLSISRSNHLILLCDFISSLILSFLYVIFLLTLCLVQSIGPLIVFSFDFFVAIVVLL